MQGYARTSFGRVAPPIGWQARNTFADAVAQSYGAGPSRLGIGYRASTPERRAGSIHSVNSPEARRTTGGSSALDPVRLDTEADEEADKETVRKMQEPRPEDDPEQNFGDLYE